MRKVSLEELYCSELISCAIYDINSVNTDHTRFSVLKIFLDWSQVGNERREIKEAETVTYWRISKAEFHLYIRQQTNEYSRNWTDHFGFSPQNIVTVLHLNGTDLFLLYLVGIQSDDLNCLEAYKVLCIFLCEGE